MKLSEFKFVYNPLDQVCLNTFITEMDLILTLFLNYNHLLLSKTFDVFITYFSIQIQWYLSLCIIFSWYDILDLRLYKYNDLTIIKV